MSVTQAASGAIESAGLESFYVVAYVGLGVSLLLALVRMLLGPTLADRVVALDLMAFFAAASIALTSIATGRRELIIVAIVMSLLVFLGTVAFAMYLERKGLSDDD